MNPFDQLVLRKLGFLDFNKPVYVPYPVYVQVPAAGGAGKAPTKASTPPGAPVHHRHRRHHKHAAAVARALFF